jgi:hypothetical protein
MLDIDLLLNYDKYSYDELLDCYLYIKEKYGDAEMVLYYMKHKHDKLSLDIYENKYLIKILYAFLFIEELLDDNIDTFPYLEDFDIWLYNIKHFNISYYIYDREYKQFRDDDIYGYDDYEEN